MKFGLNVPNYGSGGTPDALNAWAVLAEDEGYDLVMISDHIAVTDQVHELYPAPFCDPFIALAYLAGVTQRLELGTTVLVAPYRHPLLAARMAGRFLARRVACRWPAITQLGTAFSRPRSCQPEAEDTTPGLRPRIAE
jgi:hypothetical protein